MFGNYTSIWTDRNFPPACFDDFSRLHYPDVKTMIFHLPSNTILTHSTSTPHAFCLAGPRCVLYDLTSLVRIDRQQLYSVVVALGNII